LIISLLLIDMAFRLRYAARFFDVSMFHTPSRCLFFLCFFIAIDADSFVLPLSFRRHAFHARFSMLKAFTRFSD